MSEETTNSDSSAQNRAEEYALRLDEIGYAYEDVMEGWIGTYLKHRAARFKTREEAEACRRRHYGDWMGNVEVVEIKRT